jgi:hypothetical protein
MRRRAVGGTEAAIQRGFLTKDGSIEISPVFSDNALRDISTAMGLGDLFDGSPLCNRIETA